MRALILKPIWKSQDLPPHPAKIYAITPGTSDREGERGIREAEQILPCAPLRWQRRARRGDRSIEWHRGVAEERRRRSSPAAQRERRIERGEWRLPRASPWSVWKP